MALTVLAISFASCTSGAGESTEGTEDTANVENVDTTDNEVVDTLTVDEVAVAEEEVAL